jgi:hypothetical protein
MKKFLLLPAILLVSAHLSAQVDATQTRPTGTITGRVLEQDSEKQPIEGASVRILSLPDSALVDGAATDSLGRFSIKELPLGRYVAEVSLLGFATIQKVVQFTEARPTASMGDVLLLATDIMLDEATVTANAIQVTVKEDTVIYNANAFRVQEGSMLEDLIKKLPGAEVGEDGSIKINGKEIKKILVDGKEFFSDDPKVAIKNLPANMVNKLKSYDKKSDFTQQTGIDDGNEEAVLDLQVKPGMKSGWVGNIALGKGSEDRYNTTLNANRFRDDSHFSIVAGGNNVNSQGFGEFGGAGRGGGGGGGGGITASKNAGFSFAKDFSETLKIGGDFNYRHSDNDASRVSHSDTQYGDSMGTVSDSYNGSGRVNNEVGFNFRIEWKPDTLTTLTFRPRISTSKTYGEQYSGTASDRWESLTLSEGTHEYLNPADYIDRFGSLNGYEDWNKNSYLAEDKRDTIINGQVVRLMRVNNNNSNSESNDKSFQIGGSLQGVRRLNSAGRNISVNLNYTFQERSSDDLSYTNMIYHQKRPSVSRAIQPPFYTGAYTLPEDSVREYNRYNDGYNKSLNFSAGASYSEPLWTSETNRAWLQLNYSFSYRQTTSSRYGYEYNYLINDQNIGEANWNAINWDLVRDSVDLGSVYENLYTSHNIEVSMRHNFFTIDSLGRSRLKAELSYGLTLIPQHSETDNIYGPNMPGLPGDIVYGPNGVEHILGSKNTNKGLVQQDVVNWSPNLRFRYRFTQQETLQMDYRGRSNAPNVENLQEVISKTDPNNVRYGNPALKPSFQHTINVNYNRFNVNTRRSINSYASFGTTQNTTATKTLNDRTAGSRVSKVVNLSGNWNANANFGFNLPLDKQNRFNVNAYTNASYSENKSLEQAPLTLTQIKGVLANHVDASRLDSINDVTDLFITEIDLFDVTESKTRNLRLGQNLTLSYQNAWLEVRLNGSVTYSKITNNTQTNNNRETYDYRAGGSTILNLPYSIAISTDANFTHRDGYSAGLTNNEVMWNAQISKSFLAGNAAMIRFNIYDILHQQTNISRSISATTITDTQANTLNSYVMLTFTYRFNTLGGQNLFGSRGGNRGGGQMFQGGGNFGGGGFGGGAGGGGGRGGR